MRVLHIITGLGQGGAQSMLRGLLSQFSASEGSAHVISLGKRGAGARDIRALGIEVMELGMPPSRFSILPLARLARWIRAARPDVIQTWLYHADLLGGLLGRFSTRAPVVWGIHHTLEETASLKPLTRNIVGLNARLSRFVPTSIVCCSFSTLETHARQGYDRAKMQVIKNGVDTGQFRPNPGARADVRKELRLAPGTRLVGMFARFHKQKDHGTFLAAARLLHARAPGVHFVLAGKAMHVRNAQLRQSIREAGLTTSVHLLGSRTDMPRLQAAMDLCTLSSSEGEALPLTLAEAMACGVPCVATDVGDTADLLGDTGRCVAPRDPAALAEGWRFVLALRGADRHRLGSAARRRIQEEYSLRAAAEGYHGLYARLVEAGGGR